MSRVISVVSGKGGTGKTTAALNIGVALTRLGRRVILVDCSVHTPNIAIHLGSPRLPVSIHHVLKGEKEIREAIYSHPSGIRVIAGDISRILAEEIRHDRLRGAMEELGKKCDYVILDSSPGIGADVLATMKAGDKVLLVTTPDICAVTDAMRAEKTAKSLNIPVMGAVINRARGDQHELSEKNVEMLMETPILGLVPEDDSVRASLKLRHPAVHSHPYSPASIAFKKIAAEIMLREE